MLRSVVVAALVLQTAAGARFDASRAWEHLTRLVALGPRPAGSPAIESARKYIRTQLMAAEVHRISKKGARAISFSEKPDELTRQPTPRRSVWLKRQLF